MLNDAYGNLGNEMKAMKDGRAHLMAGLKQNRNRIRVETGQTLAAAGKLLAETSKANGRLAAETRQMLAQADRDSKARTHQTMMEANELVAAIRKDVAALKADAGRIIADAGGFLARTSLDNAKLKVQTRRMLSQARADSKAQTRQTMDAAGKTVAQTKQAVNGLKAQTTRVLEDAAGVLKQLSDASHRRATAWRDILRLIHGGVPGASAHAPAVAKAAAKTAARHTRSNKRARRKVA